MTTKVEMLVRNHPHVEEISDERDMDAGIWAYMKPGWIREQYDEVHNCHEETWTALLKALRNAAPCNCKECQRANQNRLS
jgi:hypothetical protein